MAILSQETREKIGAIVTAANDYAALVGERRNSADVQLGCQPGLGMESESRLFREKAGNIRSGVFNTLFMGVFKSGKSTLINCLLGENLLPAKATACTAVITEVKYGETAGKALICKKTGECEEMPLEAFKIAYQLTIEDHKFVNKRLCPPRFADIEKVILETPNDLVQNGSSIIDTAGLEEDANRTAMTLTYVSKADAVVYLMNAISVLSENDKDYIAKEFYHKVPRNIFFVTNRFDLLTTEENKEVVKASVRDYLRPVFTSPEGGFDEELFARRVFYVDSWGALNTKLGKKTPFMGGKYEAWTDLKDTGVPELEKELSGFLGSGERMEAAFGNILLLMAGAYNNAGERIAQYHRSQTLSLKELEKRQVESGKKLMSLEGEIVAMERTIDNTATVVADGLYNAFCGCAIGLNKNWEEYTETLEEKFGATEMFAILWKSAVGAVFKPVDWLNGDDYHKNQTQQKIEQTLQPLVDDIESYIKQEFERCGQETIPWAKERITELLQSLGEQVEAFDLDLTGIENAFSGDKVIVVHKKSNKLQQALSFLNWDASLLAEGVVGGGISWPEYMGRVVIQIALDFITLAIFGPWFLAGVIVFEIFSAIFRAHKLNRKLLNEFAEKTFPKIFEELKENEAEIKGRIHQEFADRKTEFTKIVRGLLEDERNRQDIILEDRRNNSVSMEKEECRMEQVREQMLKRLKIVFKTLYRRDASQEDIARLTAVKESA